jgi:hypothetical protein
MTARAFGMTLDRAHPKVAAAENLVDERARVLYHQVDKFALTFFGWADLNFMQSG